MNISTYFGAQVRKLRKDRGLSQDELAELSGLHRTYIGAVERGERNITLINAERIAFALSTTLDEIVKDYDHK